MLAAVSTALSLAACAGSDTPTEPDPGPDGGVTRPAVAMKVVAAGDFLPSGRTTGEVFVRGTTAYTTTWNNRGSPSPFYIWDVAGKPTLVDSVLVPNAQTLGDIVTTPDGKYLVVATEYAIGSIVIYSLTDPRKPQLVSRFSNSETIPGVHTAEVGTVNGKPYAFLSVDPAGAVAAKLVIVDLSDPAAPKQVFSKFIGRPYVHDTYVRDGLLFLGLWNDGVAIWDIGGGGKGGSVSNPVELGRVQTANGHVHNIWWLKDPVTGSARYAFIGEESPATVGTSASGDIHVVDVSNMSAPKEVAFYTVPGAGTHNFSVDEAKGILYAAYYNGGVRALDVRGDLGTCAASRKSTPINSATPLCDLTKMGRELAIGLLDQGNPVYVWGVQYSNGSVYASDMLAGIWKMEAVSRP
jgi:hypothetical protein